MKSIAFFNNKGGIGKTSLVYHLSWMFADQGVSTIAVDLDPQANLTSMFLEEGRLEELWSDSNKQTVYGSLLPILKGTGDIQHSHIEYVHKSLGLIPGDLRLSCFEDKLSNAWPKCHNQDETAFRTITAFYRMIKKAASNNTQIVLIDIDSNLGAINRSVLIASNMVCLPLAPDLFSLQGLKNLGHTLIEWRDIWKGLLSKAPAIEMPQGTMQPIGYIVMQHGLKESNPAKSYQKWINPIPETYRRSILNEDPIDIPTPEEDPYALALLKYHRSLIPMAQESRKPMFFLSPSDGAIGSLAEVVRTCYNDFYKLSKKIADFCYPEEVKI